MAHWGWYWHVKRNHKPRRSCEAFGLNEINSFQLFKYKEAVDLVKESADKVVFEIPRYSLRAVLTDDNNFHVTFNKGEYVISIEKKPCNFGGFYYFFRCPKCNKRIRKLYCINGEYQCRKCGNLAYYSQRLRPSERNMYMKIKVEDRLKNRAGSLDQKPPWMKRHTFQKLRIKYIKYDEQYFNSRNAEYLSWYPQLSKEDMNEPYFFCMPNKMYDAYVER